jgi:Golgi phosphoprotein 3
MASAGGLTQRRKVHKGAFEGGADGSAGGASGSGAGGPGSGPGSSSASPADGADERDLFDDGDEDSDKRVKLTLLEEVVLLGLKDQQGYLSWWNDNISYVLRGCILIELSLRGRIDFSKDTRRRAVSDRFIEVVDKTPTGDVILDEALKIIAMDEQTISAWIDLLSGETWNFMKMGYQLKQVRERIQKGLVDKGVLRTEKQNFLLFDMATHPLANMSVKDDLVRRVVDTLLRRGLPPDRRTIAMVCAAYAANVMENALVNLSLSQRDQSFTRVDELLADFSRYSDKNARQNTEVMAGVLQVFSKMDSLI